MSGSFPVLLVPGYSGGGPRHWMRVWHVANPEWARMALADWLSTSPQEWEEALEHALAALPGPAVVVAHSVGCITVARHAVRCGGGKIAGAFLVAPSDVERAPDLPMLRGFGPIPRERLAFPALVIASTDDPYASLTRATEWAEGWGAELRVLERLGHINSDSDLGAWPVGQALWQEFLGRLSGA
ncbi:MAG: serine hydrolase family protein [Candidatus Didemnitutus sp.]|nr:serine hydrolase family protein [Candidatus Didemnitutus sp.]